MHVWKILVLKKKQVATTKLLLHGFWTGTSIEKLQNRAQDDNAATVTIEKQYCLLKSACFGKF